MSRIGSLYPFLTISHLFPHPKRQNITHGSQCKNCRNLLSHFFDKTFLKETILLQKLLKSWFDEIFLREWISHFSTLWKLLFWQKFCESNVFDKDITKELIWRNIFATMCRACRVNFAIITDYCVSFLCFT